MNADDILNIIGDTDDKFIRDAHESMSNRRKRRIFNLAVGAAACLVLAPTVLFGGMWLFFGGKGAPAPAPESAPAAPAAPAEPGAPAPGFERYTGPVMALTAIEDNFGITAERSLDISFSPLYEEDYGEPCAALTDRYILTNTTDNDISLTLAYPFATSWYEGLTPELLIENTAAEGKPVYGPYTGTFIPVYGAEDDPEMATANLEGPSDYGSYLSLIMNGAYMIRSFAEIPELKQTVTVYRLSDYEFSSDSEATNPTLQFAYRADSSKTTVLTWNFNGGSNFDEEGYYERHAGGIIIRPQASPENVYPDDAYIIVLGEDISDYSVQGYRNGGCEEGEELPDLGCSVTRYESTLGEVLRELIESRKYFGNDMEGDTEALYRIAAVALMDFGPIGSDPVTRYSHGMLDEFIYDVSTQNRIAYLSFPLTIPAGESVEVEIRSPKPLCYNHYGSGNADSYRLSFAGNHGSNLDFRSIRVTLSDCDGIEIVDDCFGFESGDGILSAEVFHEDLRHWYLDICKKRVD